MYEGYVKFYRCLLKKAWINKPEYCSLWVYCLLRANHKEREVFLDGHAKPILAGSFVTSRSRISMDTGIEPSKVERILKCFESEQQIKQQGFTKYRIISICNWSKFQDNKQEIEQQMNSKRTASEQQVNTNKNDKNVKNDKNNISASFDSFWKAYPARKGKKIGKPETQALFEKLSAQEQEQLLMAVSRYAASTDYPVDPIRFFKSREYPRGLWRDWIPELPADYQEQQKALMEEYEKDAAWQ